jgi:hypothetical protein
MDWISVHWFGRRDVNWTNADDGVGIGGDRVCGHGVYDCDVCVGSGYAVIRCDGAWVDGVRVNGYNGLGLDMDEVHWCGFG